MPNQSSTDVFRIKRAFLTIFLMGVAVILPFMALKTSNPFFYVGFFALLFSAWFISKPSVMLVALYLGYYSKLVLPGLPGRLDLITLFQMVIIGWGVLHFAMTRTSIPVPKIPATFLVLFMINMFLIMVVRGFGMGSLGGYQFGGKAYILLLISGLFYLFAPQINLRERHIRFLFWGSLICSIIPALVEASMYSTGGATWPIARFFKLSQREMMDAMLLRGDIETVRWTQARYVADVALMIALVAPGIRRRKWISWSLVGLAFLLVLITGYRSRVFGLGVILFWWMVYNSKKRMATVGVFAALGLVGWLVALAIVPYLPFAMQRALSFLPLMSERISDPEVLIRAQKSIDFRVEIWGYAWKHLSHYLLIGRGLLLDARGWAWLQPHWYGQPEFFYASHSYHSGPLCLLVDFGLVGFITGAGLMIGVASHAWQAVKDYCGRRKDLLSAFYVFLTIRFSYSVIAFFLVYGSVKLNFPPLLTDAVLLCVFQRELARRQKREAELAVSAVAEPEGKE